MKLLQGFAVGVLSRVSDLNHKALTDRPLKPSKT